MPDPQTQQIVWLSPDPRAIIPLDKFVVSRSLRRRINKKEFSYSIDKSFKQVLEGCADRDDTWITDEISLAYAQLHTEGSAHSIEVWKGDKLAGGLYGVSLGRAFFAESMFHVETDASKIALYYLVKNLIMKGFELLEVQFLTPHLASLGAIEISADAYQEQLEAVIDAQPLASLASMPIYST